MNDIDPDFLAELRRAEAVSRAKAMSRDRKLNFLGRSGWTHVDGNRWRARDGSVTSFSNAVQIQILPDLNKARRR
jgi:hypothetical protein